MVLSKSQECVLQAQEQRRVLYVCPVDAHHEETSFTLSLVNPFLCFLFFSVIGYSFILNLIFLGLVYGGAEFYWGV
jgi:hypothetical protein